MTRLSLSAGILLCCCLVSAGAAAADRYPNTKLPVSSDLPAGSVYYEYVDKLEALGYVKEMLPGTRPYKRLEMARYVKEAGERSRQRETPRYVTKMLTQLERALAPELAQLAAEDQGGQASAVKVRSLSAEAAWGSFGKTDYKYNGPAHSRWQAFSQNRGGRAYSSGLNLDLSAYVSGNLGRYAAVSVSPRLTFNGDDKFSAALDEAYLTSRLGIFNVTAGKEALDWGQGVTGKLGLGTNARPLTMVRVSTEEVPREHGLLAFMGNTRWSGFIGALDGERTEDGTHDYDHPYLVGVRSDFIYPGFTLGMERLSMLSGEGNAFRFSDSWDWLRGENAYSDDKWDDIAGFDFRWKLPGVQLYGELYGEDQANYLPSDPAYRVGIFLPALTKDGRWDLRLEGAHTNNDWYVHSTYQSGWTYHHDILGDAMGRGATKYYAGLGHYLESGDHLTLNGLYQDMSSADGVTPKMTQVWVSWQHQLNDRDSLTALLGLAALRELDYQKDEKRTDKFVKLLWTRTY